jgi:hypothetical protein
MHVRLKFDSKSTSILSVSHPDNQINSTNSFPVQDEQVQSKLFFIFTEKKGNAC